MAPDQKRAWFYLQHLSRDVTATNACIVRNMVAARIQQRDYDAAAGWAVYNKRAAELTLEIEQYIASYKESAQTPETAAAFRYRVWFVVISAGDEAPKPDDIRCLSLLPR